MSSSAMDPAAIEAARQRMRMAVGPSRKGASRVVQSAARATKSADEPVGDGMNEKIKGVFRKLGMQPLPETGEVVLHKSDDTAIHFAQPRVLVSPHNNCTFVSGESTIKPISAVTETNSMMDIFNRIKMAPGIPPTDEGDNEAEIPTLVEDFEAVAEADEQKESTETGEAKESVADLDA